MNFHGPQQIDMKPRNTPAILMINPRDERTISPMKKFAAFVISSQFFKLSGSFVTPLHAHIPLRTEHCPPSSNFSLVAYQPSNQYLRPANKEAAAQRTVTNIEHTRKKMTSLLDLVMKTAMPKMAGSRIGMATQIWKS